jgi:hypothetical protein
MGFLIRLLKHQGAKTQLIKYRTREVGLERWVHKRLPWDNDQWVHSLEHLLPRLLGLMRKAVYKTICIDRCHLQEGGHCIL